MGAARLRAGTAWLFGAALAVGAAAHAATPEEAPPESRAQVQAALSALAPFYASKPRHIPRGAPGTIEDAIARYAPGAFHPVEEGAVPAVVSSAPRCPPEMASIEGRFCIDRYEGSLVDRTADAPDRDWPYFLPPAPTEGHVLVAQSRAGVVPQGYISAAQASQACAAAGKRLCQPVEWRAACGGSEGTAYPYGPRHVDGKCHDTGVAPMLILHMDEMKRGWGPAELNDPRSNQLEGSVARTGAYPGCVNDYGVYDMVGNLDEWTADPHGTFQGGFWLDTQQHGEACAYRTIAHDYGYHDYSTGFRCCRAPDAR